LAIAPLRYGAGVKGKVVDALYNGIPLITTSIGAEGIDGLNNLIPIADTSNEFISEICHLLNSPKKLKKMSLKELSCVKENFSQETFKHKVKFN